MVRVRVSIVAGVARFHIEDLLPTSISFANAQATTLEHFVLVTGSNAFDITAMVWSYFACMTI